MSLDNNSTLDNNDISKVIIDIVLPRVFPSYITDRFAPIIVGGTAVARCMTIYDETRSLLDKVFNNDIDIDFILYDLSKQTVEQAKHAQTKFITDIASSPEVASYISRYPDYVVRTVDVVIPHKPGLSVKKQQLFNSKSNIKTDVLDVVLYNEEHNHTFYTSFFKTKYPILRERNSNMLYTSCEWIFYETIRMMYIYDSYLSHTTRDKPNTPSRKYIFRKLVRYVLKFCVLFAVIHEGKGFEEFKPLYNHVRELLVGALSKTSIANKADPTIPKHEQRYLHRLINQILRKKRFARVQVSLGQVLTRRKSTFSSLIITPSSLAKIRIQKWVHTL